MRKRGSYGTAFETIIASGVCSAFPHGGCCDRIIREGDLVVVDVGATYKFYRSDMTRTLVAGKPSEKQKRLYEIVKTAQDKRSRLCAQVLRRETLTAQRGKLLQLRATASVFVHGLGHGVGLENT